MWRGLLLVFICILGLLPEVAKADPVESSTLDAISNCTPNSWNGSRDQGGWWSTVCAPKYVEALNWSAPFPGAERLQAYTVVYKERYGSNNPQKQGEFMVVVVKKGVFSLDLRGHDNAQALLTSPIGQRVPLLMTDDPYPTDESMAVIYRDSGATIQCELGCLLDYQQPVMLQPNDVIVLKKDTFCFICSLGETPQMLPGSGALVIFAALPSDDPDDFSWSVDWKEFNARNPATPDPDVELAPDSSSPTRFAWAFNPGNSRCGGGH